MHDVADEIGLACAVAADAVRQSNVSRLVMRQDAADSMQTAGEAGSIVAIEQPLAGRVLFGILEALGGRQRHQALGNVDHLLHELDVPDSGEASKRWASLVCDDLVQRAALGITMAKERRDSFAQSWR